LSYNSFRAQKEGEKEEKRREKKREKREGGRGKEEGADPHRCKNSGGCARLYDWSDHFRAKKSILE
jgi:hypothetical protein